MFTLKKVEIRDVQNIDLSSNQAFVSGTDFKIYSLGCPSVSSEYIEPSALLPEKTFDVSFELWLDEIWVHDHVENGIDYGHWVVIKSYRLKVPEIIFTTT